MHDCRQRGIPFALTNAGGCVNLSIDDALRERLQGGGGGGGALADGGGGSGSGSGSALRAPGADRFEGIKQGLA